MTISEGPQSLNFDVAVVGAGPAGSATARWIAQRGPRVALIERSCFGEVRIGESLAPAVQPVLAELGVWPDFLALNPQPSNGTRSAWGEAALQVHSHVMNPWGCGWHVDRKAFDHMLASAAVRAGAVLLCHTTVEACRPSAAGWELTLQDEPGNGAGGLLRARVLVDATGRGARLAPWLGARRLPLDHLVSVSVLFEGLDTEREGYVMVEATSDGWWYSAPVPEGRMMVMLMTDGDLCGRAKLASHRPWFSRLHATAATRTRVCTGTPSWGPRVFSAITQRLCRRERQAPWLAVGDAALAVDPISGSGVVRALRSARSGAETALSLLDGRTSATIDEYETERDDECSAHLHERALYYGMERRWPNSPFWRRRAVGSADQRPESAQSA